ncbi:MAG: hypothetical protein ACI9F9_000353 [Candidatus Paceibacteria bacterium]|jgi:hypothetical protein
MIQSIRRASVTLPILLFANLAQADLGDWVIAVAQGSSVNYMSTSVTVPSDVNIGTMSPVQGLTYEFVVNCSNAGLSSTLMGSRGTGLGTDCALKFEQYANTTSLGITDSGVADYTMASNIPLQDFHVAFVSNTVAGTSELFINGLSSSVVPYAPHLTNLVGLGHWYSPTGTVDPLTGSIYGVAVYESMLSAAELLEHATAFNNNLLGTPYCFGLNCPCGNSDPSGGCSNSTAFGARIKADGSTSISSDDLVLQGSGLAPGAMALLFVGNQHLNGGSGVFFGDGLRCAGGPLQRLGIRIADSSGNATWGPGLLSNASWANVGSTSSLQIWSQDSNGPCGAGYNTSHGLDLVIGS